MSRADERVNFINPLHSHTQHNDKQRTKVGFSGHPKVTVVWKYSQSCPDNFVLTLVVICIIATVIQEGESVSVCPQTRRRPSSPLKKHINSNSHVDSWKRGRKYVSVRERRRNEKARSFRGLIQRNEKIVLGSPTAVMALNLFLVEKFQAHYV